MQKLTQWLRRTAAWLQAFLRDRGGVSTVEYALIVVAVIGIVAAVTVTMSGAFNELFNDLATAMNNAGERVNPTPASP